MNPGKSLAIAYAVKKRTQGRPAGYAKGGVVNASESAAAVPARDPKSIAMAIHEKRAASAAPAQAHDEEDLLLEDPFVTEEEPSLDFDELAAEEEPKKDERQSIIARILNKTRAMKHEQKEEAL